MAITRRGPQSDVKGKSKSDSEHSDDDFMTTPPQVFRGKKQKLEIDNNKVIDGINENVQKGNPRSVNIRNPPNVLVDVIHKLSNRQKEVVRRIGFQHLLDLEIQKLPLKLGYWLVDNYDSETNTLRIGNKKLLVSREAVHAVYGFPLGKEEIKVQKKASTEDVVVQEFQSQFPDDLKRLRVSHIISKILEDKDGGRMFLVNFLVLTVSVLIGAPGVGTVNRKFLPNIIDEQSVSGLD